MRYGLNCTSQSVYIYRVRFEMKIVGYLLHNGNGNGLGDWGQNLRKHSGPRPPSTPFVWPDKISARIEIHFCQNWNIFLGPPGAIFVQPDKFFCQIKNLFLSILKLYLTAALWVTNIFLNLRIEFFQTHLRSEGKFEFFSNSTDPTENASTNFDFFSSAAP